MAENEKELIRWKTDAWKDPAMVAWYAGRMAENSATDLLKKQVEVNLVGRFACGHDVLEIGIGSGGAALPLVRRGMAVTGVAGSPAILAEACRQVGHVPCEMLVGDADELPVPDAAFDYLVSLNVLANFPRWQSVLGEWQRVLRPTGRLMFDIHSLDHLEAVYGAEAAAKLIAADIQEGQGDDGIPHARAADLVEWADANGMTVVAMVPVGLFGGDTPNHWLRDTLEDKFWWRRLLGWMTEEKPLFQLAALVEEHFVARLTTQATYRTVVVFDNIPDREANRRWLDENTQRNALLCGNIGIPEMHRIYGPGLVDFADALGVHLRSTRNRYFLYVLFKEVLARKSNCDIAALLPANIAALYEDWLLQDQLDDLASEITDTWYRTPRLGDNFRIAGTALGPALEYGMTERILKDCFGVYSGVRS